MMKVLCDSAACSLQLAGLLPRNKRGSLSSIFFSFSWISSVHDLKTAGKNIIPRPCRYLDLLWRRVRTGLIPGSHGRPPETPCNNTCALMSSTKVPGKPARTRLKKRRHGLPCTRPTRGFAVLNALGPASKTPDRSPSRAGLRMLGLGGESEVANTVQVENRVPTPTRRVIRTWG